jgi:hypothetical protein
MFRILQKNGFNAGQIYEFGRCEYGGGTSGCTRILDFLRGMDFDDEEIIDFGQWVYSRDITDDPDLTTKEVLELTTSGFSNRIIPALVLTYHKSKNADEAIASFYFLQTLGVDVKYGRKGSKILLSAAKHACVYDLDDSQRETVKSILVIALEPNVGSFKKRHVWAAKRLLAKL